MRARGSGGYGPRERGRPVFQDDMINIGEDGMKRQDINIRR